MAREFYNLIKANTRDDPDRTAIIDGEVSLTYAQLLEKVEKFSAGLETLNLGPDSKLGIFCLNQKEFLIALLGSFLKGVPVVPFNLLLGPEDLVFVAQDAGVDAVLLNAAFVKPETAPFFNMFRRRIVAGQGENVGLLKEGFLSFDDFLESGDTKDALTEHKRNAGVPDVILYTSGTTARPKGVTLNEPQFFANTCAIREHLPFSSEDRVIMALPLFHSFGNIIALVILQSHATLILVPQFAPKTLLGAIDRHKASVLPLVPTIYSFLADLYQRGGYDVSSLKYCISGGAALPVALLHRVEEILGVTVVEGYGLTETAPVIAVNTFKDGSIPGSVGPPLSNVETRIADDAGRPVKQGEVGEICVRGPSVTEGYWKRPEETREAFAPEGWFKTGDLGHIDEAGRLYISAGRKKDLIIRAGENISPLAIENALMNHPAVAEAAAIGTPHERMGEQVSVCVVLREGGTATPAELKEFCRKNLPAYMVPDNFIFCSELPKNAAGKILKKQLKEEFATGEAPGPVACD